MRDILCSLTVHSISIPIFNSFYAIKIRFQPPFGSTNEIENRKSKMWLLKRKRILTRRINFWRWICVWKCYLRLYFENDIQLLCLLCKNKKESIFLNIHPEILQKDKFWPFPSNIWVNKIVCLIGACDVDGFWIYSDCFMIKRSYQWYLFIQPQW